MLTTPPSEAAAAAPASKTCAGCGHTVPLDALKRGAGGRPAAICRPCDAARARARYWRDPEATRRRRRVIRKAAPDRFRGYACAYRRRHLGASRARARARAKTERARALNRQAVARYAARNPEKIAARRALASAVKRGEVKRAISCEVRGCDRSERLHAHHPDYAKPLAVVFVCGLHHEASHHEGPQPLKPGGRPGRAG